ncbi:MAG: hypothetical protein ACLGHN_04510 [Bacteriovoracia bacterium]
MKWLILLALISCGKHEEPTAKDIRDSDGDQVLNYEESDLDKYVARIEPLGIIKGKIRFTDQENFEIPFSNDPDLRRNIFDLMVSREKKIKQEDYFAERTKVRIEAVDSSKLTKDHYQIYLQFSQESDQADEIVIVEGSKSTSLGKWVPEVRLSLSAQRLKNLLEGQSFISLKKKFKKSPLFSAASEETIRNNTYRVHYFDGTSSKILYVARKLSFKSFQAQLGINSSYEMSVDDFFFNSSMPTEKQWYSRELTNGDKILIHTDLGTLKENFKKKHLYQRMIILRENGVPQTILHLNNKSGATVYLRISDYHKTERTFSESKADRWFGGGGGREEGSARYRCAAYFRNINSEKTILPELSELVGNLQETSVLSTQNVLEIMGETGPFWEVKVTPEKEDIALSFKARPKTTFTVTGEYRSDCREGRPAPSYSTNTEGKMAFEVESFVEKIEE